MCFADLKLNFSGLHFRRLTGISFFWFKKKEWLVQLPWWEPSAHIAMSDAGCLWTTKMRYNSQLSLAARVLQDPSRCSKPAFLTAMRCIPWFRNQVSALSACLAHLFPSQHGRRKKMKVDLALECGSPSRKAFKHVIDPPPFRKVQT